MEQRVDHTALRFNQACIIGLLILAFLIDASWLVAFVAAVMLAGAWQPNAGLFKQVYGRWLKPAGVLKPDIVADEPQPHLFAQGVGGLVLLVSTLALLAGAPVLGWVLAGLVVALAAVNLFWGFCVGCFLYLQLARRGIHFTLPGWRNP
jgi:hypothetical protein